MPWVSRVRTVIQNRRIPAIGGAKKVTDRIFVTQPQIALNDHIQIAEKDGVVPRMRQVKVLGRMVEPYVSRGANRMGQLRGRLPYVRPFAFVQSAPVFAGHGSEGSVDLSCFIAHDGQERDTPAFNVPPGAAPS